MEEIMMAEMGPDDDNVVPFANHIPRQDRGKEKKLVETLTTNSRPITNVIDVMESEEKLNFLVEDLLPDVGLLYVGGMPGTGKTTLAIQLVGDIILGKNTMTWRLGDAAKEIRGLFLSLEMPTPELQLRLNHMYPNLTEEEKEVFRDNFLTYTDPEPFKLWETSHMLQLISVVKTHEVNLLLIDSASVSFGESLKDDVQVNKSIDNLRMMRSKFGMAMIIVCHTRKPPPGIASNPQDITLNELFGHSGVAQSATSILIMVEDESTRKEMAKPNTDADEMEKKVHIVNAKSRFGGNGGAFPALLTAKKDVEKGSPLAFRRNAIPIAMTDEQKRKVRRVKSSVSEALSDINFNDLG